MGLETDAWRGLAVGSRFRRLIQNPYKILREVGLEKSHAFLDVGCGSGFLSIPASTIVGKEGIVYAVDVSEKSLNELSLHAKRYGIENIEILRTPAEKLEGVPDKSIDRAVFLFSLHHVEDIKQSFEAVRERLKQNGILLVYDPIRSRLMGHGTSPAKVLKTLNQTGFDVVSYREGLIFWKALAKPV
ncbi:MAG: class I SAM-dependent methyltransferase [Candidatus Caldarchaeum sp.]|nr:class I SAM-dependent methyltransferase [Candidatus Caldarchaeum sp.]